MKHKLSFILTIFLGVVSIKASNPLTANRANINWVAGNKWQITALSTAETKTAIQTGKFNNALYMRMLLSEFYCARCAIGATPFNNTDLAPESNWSSYVSTGNSTGQDLQPGGFDNTDIGTFITDATTYAKALRTERIKFEPTGQIPNPLDTFRGVIFIPDAAFADEFGPSLALPQGFVNKPYLLKPTTVSSTSSTPDIGKTITVSYTATDHNGKIEGKTSISLVDITLTSWDATFGKSTPSYSTQLYQITGNVLGLSATPKLIAQGYTGEPGSGKEMGTFFNNAPNNPWALVVMASYTPPPKGSTDSGKINYTIPALVQLNPLDYPPETTTPLSTLLDYPKSLYYSVSTPPTTPTEKLLRAITNGYLTSWSYNPLMTPAPLLQPNSSPQPMSTYPTPTTAAFKNNNPNIMIKGLFNYRQALGLMHIHKSDIPSLATIISNPNASTGTYVGAKGTTYTPVLSLQQASSTSPIKTAFNKMASHFIKPLQKIKNLFSKRIAL